MHCIIQLFEIKCFLIRKVHVNKVEFLIFLRNSRRKINNNRSLVLLKENKLEVTCVRLKAIIPLLIEEHTLAATCQLFSIRTSTCHMQQSTTRTMLVRTWCKQLSHALKVIYTESHCIRLYVVHSGASL